MKIKLVDLKKEYDSINNEIDVAIKDIIDNTSFIMGEPVKTFEQNLAEFCGCKYAIGVGSGTAALFLALKAHGIEKGDEVITAPNSFIATPEAIINCGATPVFVDVNEDDMLINTSKIEDAITDRTKAIVPVHLYGQVCNMEHIKDIAKRYKLIVIEDAAQAIGTSIPYSDTAILSFFPAKNLGCYGDGGAVITNDKNIADKISKLRNHGRVDKYNSDIIGHGERLDALQAAILTVKLKHLKEWNDKRFIHANKYDELFFDTKFIHLPGHYAQHQYVIRTKHRDDLKEYLACKDIQTGIHYPKPLHLQPALKYLGYRRGAFIVAEKAADEILSLPMNPFLTEGEIIYIVEKIKEFKWKK